MFKAKKLNKKEVLTTTIKDLGAISYRLSLLLFEVSNDDQDSNEDLEMDVQKLTEIIFSLNFNQLELLKVTGRDE